MVSWRAGKCVTCMHYISPFKETTQQGLCKMYEVRRAAPRVMPRFSCRHHSYAPPEIDLSHAVSLAEVLSRDLREASDALASAKRKLSQINSALTPKTREEEQ